MLVGVGGVNKVGNIKTFKRGWKVHHGQLGDFQATLDDRIKCLALRTCQASFFLKYISNSNTM